MSTESVKEIVKEKYETPPCESPQVLAIPVVVTTVPALMGLAIQ
jgi:hypothetical protein